MCGVALLAPLLTAVTGVATAAMSMGSNTPSTTATPIESYTSNETQLDVGEPPPVATPVLGKKDTEDVSSDVAKQKKKGRSALRIDLEKGGGQTNSGTVVPQG